MVKILNIFLNALVLTFFLGASTLFALLFPHVQEMPRKGMPEFKLNFLDQAHVNMGN